MSGEGRVIPTAAPIVAPSILSADFSRLAAELALVDPARDWLHCDVMDNHFVPNLTFGPLLIAAARRLTPAFLDVHLMIDEPGRIIPEFLAAGADQITVHLEAPQDRGLMETFALVRDSRRRVGLALKPGTPIESAIPYLRRLDLLLIMTVEPGFGGQSFMADQMPKVSFARDWREKNGASFLIEVDGGITPETAAVARTAGADVFVAGNAIYRAPDPARARDAILGAVRRDPSGG